MAKKIIIDTCECGHDRGDHVWVDYGTWKKPKRPVTIKDGPCCSFEIDGVKLTTCDCKKYKRA